MNHSEALWSGAILVLIFVGALSFLPAGPDPHFQDPPIPVPVSGPADAGDWPHWLEGRLQPVAEAPQQAGPADDLAGYSLVGLVEVDGNVLAMIAGRGTTRSLGVGASLEGYEAVAIEADRIVFSREGNEVVLRLAR